MNQNLKKKYHQFSKKNNIQKFVPCINKLDCGEWIVSSRYGKVLSSLYCMSQCL